MSDRRLQVFQAVAKLLSFTKAAEMLHMTQPAVTFQIRQLEEHFDTRLFDRTHNKISLTKSGRIISEYTDKIFEAYAEMENAVREETGKLSGKLTIGASTTIAEYMLPSLLGYFNKENPEISLRLRVSNTEGIVSMVENNLIDLGVVEGPVSNKSLIVEHCKQDKLVLVVHPEHPFTKLKEISPKELVSEQFILREQGSGTLDVITDYFKSQGISKRFLNSSIELGSPEAIKGAIEAHMGISVLSSVSIAKELKLGTLKAIPLNPPLNRQFSFVYQRQKFKVRSMEELLEMTREYYSDSD